MQKIHKNFCEVLIVGAGPSGLILAHELARFGVLVRIIDKNLEKNSLSKALAVQIRTLEIFKSLKLINPLEKHGINAEKIEINTDFLPHIDIKIFFENSNFNRPLIVDQPHTEKVLEEALNSLGIKVERGLELVDFVMDSEGVRSAIKDAQGNECEINSSFLIGADGAHSLVRKKINRKFMGESYEEAFILADVSLEGKKQNKENSIRLFMKRKNFLGIIPLPQKNHYRLICIRKENKKNAQEEPSIEEFQALLKAVDSCLGKIVNLNWSAKFFVRCLSVKNYQKESVFLVGDAAHIHSPAGGQGMNTGLQDSFNLAFKLAMVIKRIGNRKILDTYNQERKPVGDFLIKNTDKLFSFMAKRSLFFRLARLLMLPTFLLKPMQKKFVGILSQTNICYEKGLLCSEKKHFSRFGFKVGKRCVNYQLKTSFEKLVGIHELCVGLYFTCIIFFPKNTEASVIVDTKNIAKNLFYKFYDCMRIFFVNICGQDSVSKVKEDFLLEEETSLENLHQTFFVILRPDQHVYCMGNFADIFHVQDALAKVLVAESCFA